MKRTILRKTLIAAAVLGATIVGTNALAGPTGEQAGWTSYYIVQNSVTNRCIVVDTKPTPDGVPALAYESRALADRALAEASAFEVPDCSNQNEPAGWTSHYIVQSAVMNRCMVTDIKPAPDGVQALAYGNRALADRALAEASAYAIPDCSDPNAKSKSLVASRAK